MTKRLIDIAKEAGAKEATPAEYQKAKGKTSLVFPLPAAKPKK